MWETYNESASGCFSALRINPTRKSIIPGFGTASASFLVLGSLDSDAGFFSDFLSAFLANFSAFLSFLMDMGSVGGGVEIDVAARDFVTASTSLPERATTGRQLIGRSSRRHLYSFY